MKRVEVVRAESVKVSPFILGEFTAQTSASKMDNRVTKKALRSVAKELNIPYDEGCIEFAKKVINAYLERLK